MRRGEEEEENEEEEEDDDDEAEDKDDEEEDGYRRRDLNLSHNFFKTPAQSGRQFANSGSRAAADRAHEGPLAVLCTASWARSCTLPAGTASDSTRNGAQQPKPGGGSTISFTASPVAKLSGTPSWHENLSKEGT